MNKLTIREIWTDNERLIEEEKATDGLKSQPISHHTDSHSASFHSNISVTTLHAVVYKAQVEA